MKAPLALFIYNRPHHIKRTLSSLCQCHGFQDRPVYVFCDGPKTEVQREGVAAARGIAREMLGATASYHEAPANKGLARSIIDGVDTVTREHGRVIVVEDDLELAPGFLAFMDGALDAYAEASNVMQVSGHVFDVPEFYQRETAVLLPITTTWGWATWRRAWDRFDEGASAARRVLDTPTERKAFNLGGVYDYATMLVDQLAGRRDSWGVRFYLSVFEHDGLGVFPPTTLVRNSGFDGSGSHGRGWLRSYGPAHATAPNWAPPQSWSFPAAEWNEADLAAVKRAIWRHNGGRLGKAADVVKRLIRSFG